MVNRKSQRGYEDKPKTTYPDYVWQGAWSVESALQLLESGSPSISVDRIKLTPNEGAEIAAALARNETCEAFFLNKNSMEDATDFAAKAFADALRVNRSLVYFCLQSIPIGREGTRALTEAMKHNTSILSFNLHGCSIPETCHEFFLDMFHHNKTVLRMNLYGNSLRGASNYRDIDEHMERNKRLRKEAVAKYETAFHYAMEHGSHAPWRRAKLMVIGQGRAGKTATVRSLMGEEFDPNGESTLGISLSRTNVHGEHWKKDTSSETGHSITAATRLAIKIKSDENGAAFTQFNSHLQANSEGGDSVNNEDRFSLPINTGQTYPNADSRTYAHVVSALNLGEKSQQVDEEKASEEKAKKFEKSLRIFAHEASRPNDFVDFTIWDYGGQKVFYSLHHLFLTEFGVYLLVFDMREILKNEKKALEYLGFWLNSVRLHAAGAPLLLIGSFADQIKSMDDIKRVNLVIQDFTASGEKYPQVIMNEDESLFFFPIDNTGAAGVDIDHIRQTITKVTAKQAFVHNETPIRWLTTLDALCESDTRSWYSLGEVKAVAKGKGVMSASEVTEMLKLFHSLGVIIYLTATAHLENIVTTNPQWLIDSISQIIRSTEYHAFDMVKMESVGLKQEVEELLKNALASQDLLDYLWVNSDFIVDLMRETLLLSDWNFVNSREGDSPVYLVPSLLEETALQKQEGDSFEGWRMNLDFSQSWLPSGLFQRFLCSCITLCSRIAKETREHVPELTQSTAMIWVGNFGCLFIEQNLEKNYIQVTFQNETVVQKTFLPILSTLKFLNQRIMNNGLKWNTKLETCYHKINKGDSGKHICHYVPFEEVKTGNISPWFNPVKKQSSTVSLNLEGFLAM